MMDDSENVRYRQMWIAGGTLVLLVTLVILGLWWSNPNRKTDAAQHKADTEAVSKQFATPASALDPADVWITRSEAQLADMQKQNAELARQVAELTKAVKGEARDDYHGMPPNLQYDATTDANGDPLPDGGKAEGTKDGDAEKKGEKPEAAGGELPALPPAPDGNIPASLPAPPPAPAVAPGMPAIPPAPPGAGGAGVASPGEGKKPGILSIDLGDGSAAWQGGNDEDGKPQNPDGKARPRDIREYLPAGTFIRAALLSGLDAPTGGQAQSNPQPVLLRLEDDGTLPNQFSSRVRSCHLTAAGYGDIASERAYLRLERMSCVLRDGKVVDNAIKGFVTGEDGKAGIRGNLVSKQGQMIAKALVSGVAGGIGSGISQAYSNVSSSATTGTVTTVDPSKIAEFGVGIGFGKTLEKIADWYLQRANETYPIIEVSSGRGVDIVLTEGFGFGTDILTNAADDVAGGDE